MTEPLTHSERDLFVMALTLFGEARGLPEEGQAKVAWVIRNRASRTAFAGALWDREGAVTRVCRAPWQFSCWNDTDPNAAKLNKSLFYFDSHDYELTKAKLQTQLNIARAVLSGEVDDSTNGADHYHTIAKPEWAVIWPPDWTHQYGEVARDQDPDGHVFYSSLVQT
jgi:N-acetylmuramoyl-L-alanine amidase